MAVRFSEEDFARLGLDSQRIQLLDSEGNVVPKEPTTPPAPTPPPRTLTRPRNTFPTPPPQTLHPPPRRQPAPPDIVYTEPTPVPTKRRRKLSPLAEWWVRIFQFFIVSCVSVMFIATPGILLAVLLVLTLMIGIGAIKVKEISQQ